MLLVTKSSEVGKVRIQCEDFSTTMWLSTSCRTEVVWIKRRPLTIAQECKNMVKILFPAKTPHKHP